MLPPKYLTDELRQYATDQQWRIYVAYTEEGTVRGAAKALGMAHSSVSDALAKLMHVASKHGYQRDPEYIVKGESLYESSKGSTASWTKTRLAGGDPGNYELPPDPRLIAQSARMTDSQGKVIVQWDTYKREVQDQIEAINDFAAGLAAELPRAPLIIPSTHFFTSLMPVYLVGDHHVGALCCAKETLQDNYDLEISKQILTDASHYLINTCPPSEQCVVAVMGDFYHYDSRIPVTPTSRNQLASEGRFQKMAFQGAMMLRALVKEASQHHQKVHVVFIPGNHDPMGMQWSTILLAALYEENPNVTVDVSPSPFKYFHWGKNLLGFYHGDKAKMAEMPLIMANDCPDWSASACRTYYLGHVHHGRTLECDYVGCRVEALRVLVPSDDWASEQGFRNMREMKATIYHRDGYRASEHYANPRMFQ